MDVNYFYHIHDEFTGVLIDTHWLTDSHAFSYGSRYENADVVGTIVKIEYPATHTVRVTIRELA